MQYRQQKNISADEIVVKHCPQDFTTNTVYRVRKKTLNCQFSQQKKKVN